MSPLAQYVAQTGVTILGIAVLAWLVLYAGRRVGLARDEQHLRLRGALRLDARRSVYLVEVAGRVLVVAAGEGGISKLAELRREELGEETVPAVRSFSDVLQRLRGAAPLSRAESAPATGEDTAISATQLSRSDKSGGEKEET